jgi:hypothetical protein
MMSINPWFMVLMNINRRSVTQEKSIFIYVIGVLLSCCANMNGQNIPPRVEVGGVLSAAAQSDIGNYFHFGGGDPNPPPFCIGCSVLRRQTLSMIDWGGGFEIVPTGCVAVRFDVTHANFTYQDPFYFSESGERRTYLRWR